MLASSSVVALLIGSGASAAFAQCAVTPATNQSSVSNSGAINCINITGINVSGDVTNTATGTLTATGAHSPSTTGITISNASVGGSVSNAGHVTASSNGIRVINNSAVSGSVSNSGTIAAAFGHGIDLSGLSSFSGGISNSGTISSNRAVVILDAVRTFGGGISNSGTLSAFGSFGTGVKITQVTRFGSSSAGGITNSGVISAQDAGISMGLVRTFLAA